MIDGRATETRAGAHGPVVVRTATTEGARRLLAQEAERLDQARHPGIVELVEATPDQLTIAWAGAQTLELLTAPIPVLCGVVTSVASTVADLHEIGIIHGRLDASHVVIDAHGRPRLCGMRGLANGEPVALPTDDVLAIGNLIDHLVGSEAEPEPIPERRWSRRRWTGYQRRALQLVADRATHDDPARRPTARELAAALAEAVPDAQLAAPSPRAPMAPTSTAERAQVTSAAAGTPTDVEQPPPPIGPSEPLPPLPSPPPPAFPPADQAAAPRPAESPTPRPVGATRTQPPPSLPTFLGMRVEHPPPSPDQRVGHGEHRPLSDESRQPRPRSGHPNAVVAAAIGLALVGIVGVGLLVTGGDGPSDQAATSPAAERSTTTSTPQSTSAPPSCTTATPTLSDGADLDGDGCPDPVEIDGTRVTADGVAFEVGQQGDRVKVADWNCDGRATPALVRPGTGEIFVFSEWVESDGPVSVAPATVVPGAVALVAPDPGPCSTNHVVQVVGGTTVPVDLEALGS